MPTVATMTAMVETVRAMRDVWIFSSGDRAHKTDTGARDLPRAA